MPRVRASIRIHAPPDAVTRVLLDPALAPAWTTGLDRLEVVRGVPGEPGCVGHAHYVEGRRRYVLTDLLEEADPGRRYVSRITGGGLTARIETTLETDGGDATRLTIDWDGRGTSPLTRLMLPFMRGRIARGAMADLEKLRRLAEEGAS